MGLAMAVGIWALWCSFPPVDAIFSEESLCMVECVLRIIILHEFVAVRINILDKW